MAETPFSPESGAPSGGTAPEDGNQGIPVQPPIDVTPEPVPSPVELGGAPATLEPLPLEPLPSEPLSAPQPPAAVEAPAATSAFSAPAAETTASEPVVPAPTPAEQPLPPPGVAATITVPPLEKGESAGGGEWELLVERFNTWWNSGELNRQWQRIRGPLKGVAIVVVVLLALQVYATVVRTIDAIPLVSGLLELTGLIAVLQFSSTRLLRSGDRQEALAQLQRRWVDFRGRG